MLISVGNKNDLLVTLRQMAIQRYLTRIKVGFKADFDELQNYVHAKLRSLGAADNELKDLV